MMYNPSTGSDRLPFYSYLINAIPGKHLVMWPDAPAFTIAAVSDDYLAAFNQQREQLIGHGIFDVLFRDEQNSTDQLRQALTQVVDLKQVCLMAEQHHQWFNPQTGTFEWRIWRPVNKPVMNTNGELVCIIYSLEDITHETKLAEITQTNQYLQTIINLLKEPLQILQPVFDNGEIIDFRFKLVNQAYASYAASTPQQLQGKLVGEVFPGYFETVSFTNPVETYKTGQPLTFEIHYDKDGLDLYNLMSTFKLEEEVIILFIDFTRLRHLQLQLERKIDELNRSNEDLRQFAFIASHDLQEPLRKIQSFSSLLSVQLDDQLTETSRDYLQRINSAVARMSTLIKDLLTYSRISSQRKTFVPVSLPDIVADALTTFDWEISQRQAQIAIGELPTVTGDYSQLGQLFQNLLSNAMKFTQAGQRPLIEISCQLFKRTDLSDSVSLNSDGLQFYQISVRDNGIGFEPKYLDRIFQMFQRLHGKNEYVGTGIGLAICQRVAENHGGGITAVSKPGEGSTFFVYLPA